MGEQQLEEVQQVQQPYPMQLLNEPKLEKGGQPSLMKDNASFGGEDEREEDLDGLCDSLRDELLSDQMSDGAHINIFERDIETKPIER